MLKYYTFKGGTKMKKETKQKNKTSESVAAKDNAKKIIEDIIPVRDENGEAIYIDIVLEDGTSFPVPNTKSALLHYRNIMLKQALAQKGTLESTRSTFNGCRVMFFAGIAGAVLVNTTELGKEIGQVTGSIISGVVTIACGTGMMVANKKLPILQRNVTFACHKDEINSCVAENPHIYINVCEKDRKLIEGWLSVDCNEPIAIENLHMLEPNTIQLIWKNICLYKHFGFKYKADGKVEEPGFQKIIVEKDKKEEQSK